VGGNWSFKSVVFPVPRAPKRKKLFDLSMLHCRRIMILKCTPNQDYVQFAVVKGAQKVEIRQ
jgi:hypothetical protein